MAAILSTGDELSLHGVGFISSAGDTWFILLVFVTMKDRYTWQLSNTQNEYTDYNYIPY